MKYMLMIWEPDVDWAGSPPDHLARAMEHHGEFARMLEERGIEFTSNALSHATKTIRRPGKVEEWVRAPLPEGALVTDGPYAELKEHLGGFYIVDVKDLDEALEIARQMPTFMATEVRAVWEPGEAVRVRAESEG
jgi:hypothetical protein